MEGDGGKRTGRNTIALSIHRSAVPRAGGRPWVQCPSRPPEPSLVVLAFGSVVATPPDVSHLCLISVRESSVPLTRNHGRHPLPPLRLAPNAQQHNLESFSSCEEDYSTRLHKARRVEQVGGVGTKVNGSLRHLQALTHDRNSVSRRGWDHPILCEPKRVFQPTQKPQAPPRADSCTTEPPPSTKDRNNGHTAGLWLLHATACRVERLKTSARIPGRCVQLSHDPSS